MPTGSTRSRVSRETRLLLLTVLLSVVTLLVLARLRFPERPATPALVPPLLTQLVPPTPFEDLANAVSTIEAEVVPALELVTIEPTASAAPQTITALRLREDAAVALVAEPHLAGLAGAVMARDRATGLAIVRVPPAPVREARLWTPQRAGSPRYLLVTEASPAGVSLRPVFVGALRTATSHVWQTAVWIVPQHLSLARGAFVFSTTGTLAGLVADDYASQAIVPAAAILAAGLRLLATPPRPPGTLGLSVQAITPAIAAAIGTSAGVVVTQVDTTGPADSLLAATDVVQAVNGQPLANRADWEARVARLAAGDRVTLRVLRGDALRDVLLAAAAAPEPAQAGELGLTLRASPGRGAAVTAVGLFSAAARAGLAAGDVITRAGNVTTPSPAQIARFFEALPAGGGLLVAVTRDREHLVLAIVKP